MRLSTVALSLATAGTLVAAQPHRHHHRHADRHNAAKRAPAPVLIEAGWVTVTTVTVTQTPGAAAPSVHPTEAPKPNIEAASVADTSPAAPSSSAPAKSDSAPKSDAAPQAGSGSGSGSGSAGSYTGVDKDFPDGQIDCSHFPSDYGAVAVDWAGLGGWSGTQDVGNNYANGKAGDKCKDNTMCSYSCPPGYLKTQWPKDQPASGASVGGLKCEGGKLKLTNPSLSTKLCMKGVGGISVSNKVGKGVAVCRTDYPGNEAQTVPATYDINASSYELGTPDQKGYFFWKGSQTSAQYYINAAGVPIEEGCQWNVEASNKGNFAPINIGASQDNGLRWLSIHPTEYFKSELGFNIRIKGDSVSDECYYEHPKICQGGNCKTLGEKGCGCTVSSKGDATYEFY
ncbi:MAG: hypothetical protein M1832_002343 [Thelocarpon impressellum]|nr:MAG: hypothetical protein M1832_002343 [Thelocarpon impressellum]